MKQHPWLADYPKNVQWDEPIVAQPLYQLLDNAVERFPQQRAIDFLGKVYLYEELSDLVGAAAQGFVNLGVKKGTKVGLFLPNCPQFVIAYFAILKAGGVVVNFSPLYSSSELEFQLIDSDTEIMVTLDLELLYPKIHKLIGQGKLRQIVVGTMQEALPFPKSFLFPLLKKKEIVKVKFDDQHIRWSDICDNDAIIDMPEIDPENDVAVLQYTGGTTGVPKGAVLTHANVHANACQASAWCTPLEDGEGKTLAVLPFFHVFAMTVVMNLAIKRGFEIVLHPRFELKNVLKDIQRKKPNIMPGVPTMYTAINNHPKVKEFDLSSLKVCISGGAGLPLEVKHKFEELTGCSLVEGYGLTESSPVNCCNPIEGLNKEGSIGLPLPQTEILIEDMENKGVFLPANEHGELCIKGPQVMQGYWKRDDATAETIQDDILRTGDVGYMDEQGYVFVVDRIKELIIAGGYNIYPRAVEEAIYKHPSVLEAAVVGIKDAYRGETVKAFIALKPKHELTDKELKTFLKDKLGRHEMPTHVEFRDELPKTMIGKISKKDL
jgi:long-chain acyl-CoA synthetase